MGSVARLLRRQLLCFLSNLIAQWLNACLQAENSRFSPLESLPEFLENATSRVMPRLEPKECARCSPLTLCLFFYGLVMEEWGGTAGEAEQWTRVDML